jgi:hypothetical protein
MRVTIPGRPHSHLVALLVVAIVVVAVGLWLALATPAPLRAPELTVTPRATPGALRAPAAPPPARAGRLLWNL